MVITGKEINVFTSVRTHLDRDQARRWCNADNAHALESKPTESGAKDLSKENVHWQARDSVTESIICGLAFCQGVRHVRASFSVYISIVTDFFIFCLL